MANVKISDLPSLSAIDSNDVIIVNDTSESTTKKANVSALVSIITPTVTPASGITITSGSITMTVRKFATGINVVTFLFANVNMTAANNTEIVFTHDAQPMFSCGGSTNNLSVRSNPDNSLLPDSASYVDIAGLDVFMSGNNIRIVSHVRSSATIFTTAPVSIKANVNVVLNGNYSVITANA